MTGYIYYLEGNGPGSKIKRGIFSHKKKGPTSPSPKPANKVDLLVHERWEWKPCVYGNFIHNI